MVARSLTSIRYKRSHARTERALIERHLHFQCNKEGLTAEFDDVTSASPFRMALEVALKHHNIVMPVITLERDEEGGYKLQKNKVNDSGDCVKHRGKESAGNGGSNEGGGSGGPYWINAMRMETAKLAEQR